MTKCNLPHATHPTHGECTLHLGHMHTTKKDGKRFGWPHKKLHDGTKKRGE